MRSLGRLLLTQNGTWIVIQRHNIIEIKDSKLPGYKLLRCKNENFTIKF